MCGSFITSGAVRTGAQGMRWRRVAANTSSFPSLLVQALTTASVSAMFCARAAIVAKRGSSFRSSRPIAASSFCQWPSVTTWMATYPSAVANTL